MSIFIIPESNVIISDKDKTTYGIFNPAGEKVFEGEFENKKECILSYLGGNYIMWKGRPSDGWRCKKIS